MLHNTHASAFTSQTLHVINSIHGLNVYSILTYCSNRLSGEINTDWLRCVTTPCNNYINSAH